MSSRGDARLLAEVRDVVPDRQVSDALVADPLVGWVRVASGLLALTLGLIGVIIAGWLGIVVAVVAFLVVPEVARWNRKPIVLAKSGDDVLVVSSRGWWRDRPVELVDVVPAHELEIDFPGVLTDKWHVGERRAAIVRSDRTRVRAWTETSLESGVSP